MQDQEIEAKFCVAHLGGVERQLQELGAVLEKPRLLERNLRFDTPDRALTRAYRVIRLRQDDEARLTYKGPPIEQEGIKVRQEIEFRVGDYAAALRFLEALGYQVSFAYEKFRTSYIWDELHIALDELPYGYFVEIEGDEVTRIRRASRRLGLRWEANVGDSYAVLFDHLRERLSLPFSDLTFENFTGMKVNVQDLQVEYADS